MQSVTGPQSQSFDVICVGGPRWVARSPLAKDPRPQLRGAVNVAAELAADGLRVALTSELPDDTHGRALLASLRARNVESSAIELSTPADGLIFVRGGARQDLSVGAVMRPLHVPSTWSSAVLLLSGLCPSVPHGAALCKNARAARRAGATVVVDLAADWHLWQGHDARSVRMILREADVVHGSAVDLLGINMDTRGLRAALRDSAVLVLGDPAGRVAATGPFGEVSVMQPDFAEDDAQLAAICAELARPTGPGGDALWSRALRRAQTTSPQRRNR